MSKHKIDTLIISGGGPSGIAYIGIFKALIQNNILKSDLSGIQEIITTSVGILFAYLILLKINPEIYQEIIMKFDILSVLNLDDIKIDNLLVDLGLFSTDKIGNIIQSITKNCLQCEDITLKELYDRIPIKLTVKVFNVTKQQVEYISYENFPDLSIITLAQMTTAIALFFKPVKYKDHLYVDGGMRGNLPIEACESKNYLGIYIKGGTFPKNSDIIQLFPILEFIYSLMVCQDEIVHQIKDKKLTDPRIIFNEVNLGLDFNVTQETKVRVIQEAYEITMKHINDHQLNES